MVKHVTFNHFYVSSNLIALTYIKKKINIYKHNYTLVVNTLTIGGRDRLQCMVIFVLMIPINPGAQIRFYTNS